MRLEEGIPSQPACDSRVVASPLIIYDQRQIEMRPFLRFDHFAESDELLVPLRLSSYNLVTKWHFLSGKPSQVRLGA